QMLLAQLGGPGMQTDDAAERQKVVIERLTHAASLSAKGHDPQSADMVRQIQNGRSLVFGFSKQNLALTPAEKDVEFVLKLGGLAVKAKFQPKEMLYKGELSV